MNDIARRLAKKASEDTAMMMIMEYRNFESELLRRFATLIIQECCEITKSSPDVLSAVEAMEKLNAKS